MRTVRLFTLLRVLIFPVPLRRRCGTARLKHGRVHPALGLARTSGFLPMRSLEWNVLF